MHEPKIDYFALAVGITQLHNELLKSSSGPAPVRLADSPPIGNVDAGRLAPLAEKTSGHAPVGPVGIHLIPSPKPLLNSHEPETCDVCGEPSVRRCAGEDCEKPLCQRHGHLLADETSVVCTDCKEVEQLEAYLAKVGGRP